MRLDSKKYTWGDAGKNGFAPNDGCDFCGKLLNDRAKVFRNYSHQGQRREAFCSESCKNNYNQIPSVEDSKEKPDILLVEELRSFCGDIEKKQTFAKERVCGKGWAMVFRKEWIVTGGKQQACWMLDKAWKCDAPKMMN